MTLVNFLRFNKNVGAIISDEEYWTINWRRRYYRDNLHSLLNGEMSESWKMEVIYGGVGYPSLHQEVLTATQRELTKIFVGKKSNPVLVREIARIAFNELQKIIRQKLDQRLDFYFGFSSNDLHRGYFQDNGNKISIGLPKVRDYANEVLMGDKRDVQLKAVFESKGVVFGHDEVYGITGYYLDPEKAICGYNHEGFEAVGTGKYASGLVFSKMFNAQNLEMRRQGLPPAEGLLELLISALEAVDHFKEVGGNMNFIIIDGNAVKREDRFREFLDDKALLAGEIAKAFMAEQISREAGIKLLDLLIFKNSPEDEIEKELFESSRDPVGLLFALRKYKLNEISGITIDFKKFEQKIKNDKQGDIN